MVLTALHFLNDMWLGIAATVIPLLHDHIGLSYALVGSLVTITSLISLVFQPLFGLWCDRRRRPWLVPAGVLLGGLGLSLAGFAGSFVPIAAALSVVALGSAMFHPEAGRTAFNLSGTQRATGMSWFLVGGNAGMSAGPLVISALIVAYGLRGTGFLILPALLGVGALWLLLPAVQRAETRELTAEQRRGASSLPTRWGSMGLLMGAIVLRSCTSFGVRTFVPLLALASLGATPAHVSTLLSTFLGVGALSTLLLGPLADRCGRRPTLVSAMLLLVPVMLAVPYAGLWLLYPLAGLAGACTIGTWSITAVLSQEYMPQRRSLASAVNLSAATLGGIIAAPVGLLADQVGLAAALAWFPILPAAAAVLTLFLPEGHGAGARP